MGKNFKNLRCSTLLLNVVFFLFFGGFVLAEGSRDLYPSGKTGRRAFLMGLYGTSSSWPFPSAGFHYVYAKVGERIAMASSAQGAGDARIRLYAPNGTLLVDNTSGGNIANRTAELAGPRLFGQAAGGNRYLPIYHQVTTEGIYKVEFYARGSEAHQNSVDANSNWPAELTHYVITAWDVSVINTSNNGFVNGRVYTNFMNLSTGLTNPHTTGFYGIFYILTKDGYTYRVNNNGNNGMYFTFLANNNGFINSTTGDPIYKSLNISPAPTGEIHSPSLADTDKQITHKIFYNLPDPNLPMMATGNVPGGSTWLKNPVVQPEVNDVSIVGVEGSIEQVGNKGGYVKFTANKYGSYTILIESSTVPALFAPKLLYGAAVEGLNQIYWDGTDGEGNPMPDGNFPIRIKVQLNGGEVHFPFFDMEYNRFGTIVELLNHQNLTQVLSDIVYWNDIDVSDSSNGSNPNPKNNSHLAPVYSTGLSSSVNGHTFAVGANTSTTYGDNRSLDTWTFISGPITEITSLVDVKISDLQISQISTSVSEIALGQDFDLIVKVKNDGPSDANQSKFQLFIPQGLEVKNISFNGNSCGSQDVSLIYDAETNSLSSVLNLSNQCEITYTINLHVWDPVDANSIQFTGTILRPNDYTDPDATNPDIEIPPTDPFFECDNNGAGGTCNNIQVFNLNYNTVSNCYNPLEFEDFKWSISTGPYSEQVDVENSELGYMIDFYSLNHSFNLEVNSVSIFSSDIEFRNDGGFVPNIQFSDGDQYGIHTTHNGVPANIWDMEGSTERPLLRLKISPIGNVELWGSKSSGGELFPLELKNSQEFSVVPWNLSLLNEILLVQNQSNNLEIHARGFNLKVAKCPCVKPGLAGTPVQFTQIGILTKNQSDKNWPLNVPNGFLAMDSHSKGFVINHLTTAERDALSPIEGMIIYNVDEGCVQLYRGINPTNVAERMGWNCIERTCND